MIFSPFLPLLLAFASFTSPVQSANQPHREDVLRTMRKATAFMMDSVSDHGGFVWKYSLDLKSRYGEVKARKTMVWIEPPGTPTVGEMLIEAWLVTKDPLYRHNAERVADVVVNGQLSCGGWHYFIDHDTTGMKEYYRDYLSTIWGWEEHTHFYGNATFDDETTVSATRFLLRLFVATKNERYKLSALKALDFILLSQLSNGGWPQRAPIHPAAPQTVKHDYTSHATFNDDVIHNNIMMLLEAWRVFNDKRYLLAARRGMDFFIVSQLPSPQSGWAQQYDASLKPASGRRFELGTVCSGETVNNIEHLLDYYRATGDRKYLEPIPRALKWLTLSAGLLPTKEYSHTYYYELGSNRPIYSRVFIRGNNRLFESTYEYDEAYPYGHRLNINISELQQKYERISSLSSDDARAEFAKIIEQQRIQPPINVISWGLDYRTSMPNEEEVRDLIASLDPRGGWIVENTVLDEHDFIHNPPLTFRGYDTGTYVTRMYRLINYLRAL